jgi:peptide/nickel transport system substrate-binding protein
MSGEKERRVAKHQALDRRGRGTMRKGKGWAWGAILLVLLAPAAWAAPSGKVVVAQGVDPTTLDPHDHEETPAYNVLLNLYDTLLVRDKSLKIVPWLATSYKSINPTTWEFKLRKGVQFTNGEDSTPRWRSSAWSGWPTRPTI